jgi:hypothetical protein
MHNEKRKQKTVAQLSTGSIKDTLRNTCHLSSGSIPSSRVVSCCLLRRYATVETNLDWCILKGASRTSRCFLLLFRTNSREYKRTNVTFLLHWQCLAALGLHLKTARVQSVFARYSTTRSPLALIGGSAAGTNNGGKGLPHRTKHATRLLMQWPSSAILILL